MYKFTRYEFVILSVTTIGIYSFPAFVFGGLAALKLLPVVAAIVCTIVLNMAATALLSAYLIGQDG